MSGNIRNTAKRTTTGTECIQNGSSVITNGSPVITNGTAVIIIFTTIIINTTAESNHSRKLNVSLTNDTGNKNA
jgi:hypothetical protein